MMKIKTAFIFGFIALIVIGSTLYYINAIKTELDESRVHLATAQASNAVLIANDALSRSLTEMQLNREQALREQADEQAEALRNALSNSSCNNVRLPDAVIERLR